MTQQRRLYTSLALVLVAAMLGVLSLVTIGAQQPAHNSRTDGPLPADKIGDAPAIRASGRVLRADKFDALDSAWSRLDRGDLPDQRGKWNVAAGKLLQSKTESAGDQLSETSFLANVETAGNTSIAAQVYPQGNQFAGLIFRASDAGYYVFTVYRDDSGVPLRANLLRYTPATGYTTLAETSSARGLTLDRWQELRVQIEGPRITAFFDGQQIFDIREKLPLQRGKAGVTTLAVGDIAFDNFTVEQR